MLRKFFNTQLINAGMAEEIRESVWATSLKTDQRCILPIRPR
ncbi:hypothetical protein [Methanobacterium sp. BAmetb5]|nr:hypothetical protein [Methanobacterium sp. BAmetb5]